MQLYSHQAQIHTMKCFISSKGWKSRMPMSKWMKIKSRLSGFLFKLGFYR